MTAIIILAVLLLSAAFIFLLACFAFTPPDARHRRER